MFFTCYKCRCPVVKASHLCKAPDCRPCSVTTLPLERWQGRLISCRTRNAITLLLRQLDSSNIALCHGPEVRASQLITALGCIHSPFSVLAFAGRCIWRRAPHLLHHHGTYEVAPKRLKVTTGEGLRVQVRLCRAPVCRLHLVTHFAGRRI